MKGFSVSWRRDMKGGRERERKLIYSKLKTPHIQEINYLKSQTIDSVVAKSTYLSIKRYLHPEADMLNQEGVSVPPSRLLA